MKEAIVTIQPDGTTTVDMKGFQGQGCAQASEALLVAIAGTDSSNRSQDKKREFWQSESQTGSLTGR